MKRRWIALLPLSLFVAGCSESHQPLPPATADEAIARIRTIMPPGWTIEHVDRNGYPFYRREGRGTAIYLVPPKPHQFKDKPEGMIFLMPPTYDDGGPGDPTHGQAQTWPPSLIGTNAQMKVYLWCGWEGAREQLIAALNLKPAETSSP